MKSKMTTNLSTNIKPTWCPGCYNFFILNSFKKIIENEIEKGKSKNDFAIVAGIGCHAKIFDYVNLNGINTLHGRVLPTCLGMKIANPKLNVWGFSGDGDAYAEGIEHLIHMARYNSNINYVVHNNRVFALTVGQATPTTEENFKDKTNPKGVKIQSLNPILLMLGAGCGFIARVDGSNLNQIEYVFQEALKHKGFSFIEILQPCLIFHNTPYKDRVYSLEEEKHDKTNFEKAIKKAMEFDYFSNKGRIPTGIFYQKKMPVFEEVIRE
jgi:2-oxoglutarate/2-oxoacid ferredoxin oxidoreductase subunit beta